MPIKIAKEILKIIMERSLFLVLGGKVYSGPFAGMKYVYKSTGSALFPKLLGTYELELYSIIEDLCRKQFNTIISVGTGEGYYAVGFAVRNSQAHVIAFETKNEGQRLIKKMAGINGVDKRIGVHGLCDSISLSNSLTRCNRCLILMDIEGGEETVLDPLVIPKLRESHILVELHDVLRRGMGAIITSRFESSHKITEVWSRNRNLEDFPIESWRRHLFRLKKYLIRSMYENRPEQMRWFYLEPGNER